MRVVGCFFEYEGRFLILLRHSHKPDGNTWGLPSGKVDDNETDRDAMRRELEEETGYKATISDFDYLGEYNFISSSDVPYVYVTYRLRITKPHEVRLEAAAHKTCQWVNPQECNEMIDLIPGFHALLKLVDYIYALC